DVQSCLGTLGLNGSCKSVSALDVSQARPSYHNVLAVIPVVLQHVLCLIEGVTVCQLVIYVEPFFRKLRRLCLDSYCSQFLRRVLAQNGVDRCSVLSSHLCYQLHSRLSSLTAPA